MKRILLFIAVGLLFLVSVPSASAFGWKDVVKMHRAGIADSLIVQKIEYSGKTFRLSADDMAALKAEGISDEVVSAMLRTEAGEEGPGYYDDDSYGYGYYDYPHSHVYLGFGLGYYYPYRRYYGGYYGYRAYGPYYSSRYYYLHRYGGSYGYRGYTGYRGWTGNYGDTRYRSRVGDRSYTGYRGGYTGNRGYTGSRGATGHSQPGSGRSGPRTRTR